jgi:hypothetical protein
LLIGLKLLEFKSLTLTIQVLQLLGEATSFLVLLANFFFFFLLVKVKLDVILNPLLFFIDFDIDILAIFIVLISRLIFFPTDPSLAVLAVPLLHGVQLRLRFVAEVGRALRMQPRPVRALLVAIAFHEQL